MASPSSFRVSARPLTFFNQGTCPLCYPQSPPYPNGISCLTIHLPWFGECTRRVLGRFTVSGFLILERTVA